MGKGKGSERKKGPVIAPQRSFMGGWGEGGMGSERKVMEQELFDNVLYSIRLQDNAGIGE